MMAPPPSSAGSAAGGIDQAFLRAPPFPRRKHQSLPDGAAQPASNAPALGGDDAAASILQQLLDRQVGGDFWAPPVSPAAAGRHILCPSTLAQARAMLAALGDDGMEPWLAIVPPGRTGKAIGAWLQARGGMVQFGSVDPWSIQSSALSLLASADDDYCLVSQIRGRPVRRFARADGGGCHTPQQSPTETVRTHILARPPYRDGFTGAPCSATAAIDQLGDWRVLIDRNRKIAVATGMAGWKRGEIETFLWAGRDRPLAFCRRAPSALRAAAAANGAIAAWPSRVPAMLFDAAKASDIPVYQVEDGFIRSVGLGSGLHPPQSIVVDSVGIYYDPTQPSALERLLETGDFPPALLERAAALLELIVSSGISKYAAGRDPLAGLPGEGRRVLVTGQVEDDRSVLLGGGDVTGNLDLLRRARAAEPDSFILFKPHPDVEAGHRKGAIDTAECLKWADLIVRKASMAALLDQVDAVHVWTSLAGFEALLRGREVIVHGQPFFAGWGLTRDLARPVDRRTRRVSLLELVAATLILYPQYLDPVTHLPCTPERLISRMALPSARHRTLLTRARSIQGLINRWMR